jgi:homospermidine synthase
MKQINNSILMIVIGSVEQCKAQLLEEQHRAQFLLNTQ